MDVTKAIAPKEIPALPSRATGWARSTKTAGGMFHAHALGTPVCGAQMLIERHKSEEPRGLGDFQYWGVCPHCYKMAERAA